MNKCRKWLPVAAALLFTGCFASGSYYVPKGYHSGDYLEPLDGRYFYSPYGRYHRYGGIYGPSFLFKFGYPDYRFHRFKGHYPGYRYYHKPYGYRDHKPYVYKKYKKFYHGDRSSGRFVRPYHRRSW